MNQKEISAALISVFYKDKLEPIVKELNNLGITIYSTGGTQKFIEDLDVEVISVETLTSYPSILGGRVKTLHPKIFGGILARREIEEDVQQLKQYEIPEIDLVIVDLYPFEETVAKEKDEDKIIEKIDIGGISLIRATGKNYKDTLIVASRNNYNDLLKLLKEKKGFSDIEDRQEFARRAFDITSQYDMAIFNYFNKAAQEPALKTSISKYKRLRYGENPHQQGIFYGELDDMFEQLNGKELSYNNIVDIDAAITLISEFKEPAFAILKHTNACGVSSKENLTEAWKAALAGDPISAFGGIIICNKTIDENTANEINQLFFEVIIAPKYEANALKILNQKEKRIILLQKYFSFPKKIYKTVLNGVIEQDYDNKIETENDLEVSTKKKPTEKEIEDLLFANKIAKHIKSNTIVFVKDKQLIGMGSGQTSRVDALKHAIVKAKSLKFDPKGAVMASDAFFPFSDCVEIAHKEGITAIIQPGGSIRDKDSIDYCNEHDMTMVFTGVRHFRH